MTEKELIQGCKKQDRRCQNELYQKYFPLMSSIALRYCKDKEAVLQGINYGFLKVLQNIKNYDSKHALATYIRNILVNHLIDEFRKNEKYITQVRLSDFSEDDGGIDLNEGARNLEEQELRDILKQLPKVTQAVFNMYAIDGYKHKEIAMQLGISEGTSKWHVNHARKILRVLVGELYKETNAALELGK